MGTSKTEWTTIVTQELEQLWLRQGSNHGRKRFCSSDGKGERVCGNSVETSTRDDALQVRSRVTVTVELFGIPRARAGLAQTTAIGKSLGEVLSDLAARFPAFAESCVDECRLRPGFMASLGGDRFVTDPQTPLGDGESLLILSMDAGG